MTYLRYWAMALMAATADGFLAVDHYAFATNHALWIVFGVAIAAGVCSVAGASVAFVRHNHQLSGLSALSAQIVAFTVIATRAAGVAGALTVTMALQAIVEYRWTALGLGAAMVGVSLAAGLIHELTSEHVRHEVEIERPPPLEVEPVEA